MQGTMHEVCIPHGIPRAETGKSRHERVVRNLEERNFGSKRKSPKQDLTVELPRENKNGKKNLYFNWLRDCSEEGSSEAPKRRYQRWCKRFGKNEGLSSAHDVPLTPLQEGGVPLLSMQLNYYYFR